jgi:hypothetical protein
VEGFEKFSFGAFHRGFLKAAPHAVTHRAY